MQERLRQGLGEIVASLIATLLLAVSVWLYSRDLILPAVAALVAVGGISVLVYRQWRQRVRFVGYMKLPDLKQRVEDAEQSIWSFQISGGEFTRYLVNDYREWLRVHPGGQLKLLFANPDNEGLLESIVELSGMAKASSREAALTQLRDTIRTSLDNYSELSQEAPNQVDLRVYDCSPPCSVHATDVDEAFTQGSLFIEHYLPDLPWRDRPCFQIGKRSPAFVLYASHCLMWFDDARPWTDVSAPLPGTAAG